MGPLLLAGFRRYWWAMPLSGLLTALVSLALILLRPMVWRVETEVVVDESVLMARLVNPFVALAPESLGLKGLDERLISHDRLVALAKGLGLVDRVDELRSPLERARVRVLAAVGQPVSDHDALEEVVDQLREHLKVELKGRHVLVRVDWRDADTAWRIARAEFEALTRGELDPDLEASLDASASVDGRLAEVRRENAQWLAALLAETRSAARERRVAQTASELGALREGRVREEELIVRSRDGHLESDVARRASSLRYLVLLPPRPTTIPVSPTALATVLLWLVLTFASALAGPVLLTLAAVPKVPGRSIAVSPKVAFSALLGLAVLTGISTGTADGDWIRALLPLGWAVTLWLVWTLPVKWPLLALMFAAFATDDPSDRAYVGRWHSPLYDVGNELFTNVAYFTGFELRLFVLAALLLARRLLGLTIDPLAHLAPRPLRRALVISLATVSALIVMGLLRGGEFRQALWQFRFLMMLPLIALIALQAFEFPRDLKPVLLVLVAGSVVKASLGIYFMLAIAPGLEHFPPHTSGHNDSMLFVAAVVAPLAMWWERPSLRRALFVLAWVPLLLLAIRYNDRRIAYVDLAACAVTVAWLSPRHRVKRAAMRASVLLAPIVALYLAVGWNQETGRLFGFAQTIRSLVSPVEGSKQESSNADRDIENYNLIHSWERNTFVGQGFGHAFTEFLPSNDFSQSNFGHTGHNSLLWLLWIGGIFGFVGMLLYVSVGLFFFARTLGRVRPPDERAALLVALSILITFLSQAFGDMGTQSIEIAFFVALALAIIGRLATRHGAWLEGQATA